MTFGSRHCFGAVAASAALLQACVCVRAAPVDTQFAFNRDVARVTVCKASSQETVRDTPGYGATW